MIRKHFPLFWLALHRRRRLIVALAAGLASFETLIVVITAAIPPDKLFVSKGLPQSFNAFSGSSGDVSLASVAGLLGAGLLHPFWIALQLSAVASLGASAIATDIEDGTIELIAVRPVSRLRILGERILATLVTSAALVTAATIPIAVGAFSVGRIGNVTSLSGIAAEAVTGFVLVLSFTGIAIAASCMARRRATVLAIVGGAAAVSYAANFVAESWAPATGVKWLSPFHYYTPADALISGSVSGPDITVLLAVFFVGTIVGAITLTRRDLTR